MKHIKWLLGVLTLTLTTHSSAKSVMVDIAQDFGDVKFRVSLVLPAGAVISSDNFLNETRVKWRETLLVLYVEDSATNTNMPGATQIRSSDVGGRKLQVFQGPASTFHFSMTLRSSTVKGFYLSCANTFSLSSLEQVNEAIKVCDSAKIIKKL